MEDHAQSGWLCELVVGSDDARMRECESVELLVDTGATFWLIQERPSMSVGLTTSLTLH